MDSHEFKPNYLPSALAHCGEIIDGVKCLHPPSAEVHNLLTKEEAGLAVGAIPLPCPFCPIPHRTGVILRNEGWRSYSVCCYGCRTLGSAVATRERAIELWNVHANSQLVTALVEALQPFAKAADVFDQFVDEGLWANNITIGELRRARAALALLNPPLTQLLLEHTKLKAERKDEL